MLNGKRATQREEKMKWCSRSRNQTQIRETWKKMNSGGPGRILRPIVSSRMANSSLRSASCLSHSLCWAILSDLSNLCIPLYHTPTLFLLCLSGIREAWGLIESGGGTVNCLRVGVVRLGASSVIGWEWPGTPPPPLESRIDGQWEGSRSEEERSNWKSSEWIRVHSREERRGRSEAERWANVCLSTHVYNTLYHYARPATLAVSEFAHVGNVESSDRHRVSVPSRGRWCSGSQS